MKFTHFTLVACAFMLNLRYRSSRRPAKRRCSSRSGWWNRIAAALPNLDREPVIVLLVGRIERSRFS